MKSVSIRFEAASICSTNRIVDSEDLPFEFDKDINCSNHLAYIVPFLLNEIEALKEEIRQLKYNTRIILLCGSNDY